MSFGVDSFVALSLPFNFFRDGCSPSNDKIESERARLGDEAAGEDPVELPRFKDDTE